MRGFIIALRAKQNKQLDNVVLYGIVLYGMRGETLEHETQGGFLISQIKQISGRIFEKLLVNAGVEEFNGAQGRILYVLWQEDGVPIVELARKTGLAKTTLTSMLDRMENANLIKRVFDKSDRRQIRINLTKEAQKLSNEYNNVSNEMNKIYYAGFSNDEIATFENNLRRILSNLNKKE
jgi:DNA-binding MarR family transcriptional regulator